VRVNEPQRVGRPRVQIAAGHLHSCAVIANGAVWCWGDNTFGQLGIGTTSRSLRAVPVPSFSLNIDPRVTLEHKKPEATVMVLAACEDGQKLRVDVSLTQGDVSARGVGSGRCTGGLARYPVTVEAHGHKHGFDAGPAEVTAVALIRGHGHVEDTQEWTRQVEIVDGP
jgi:Regulator of Chromosome Condensation (RCC1) repeat protein